MYLIFGRIIWFLNFSSNSYLKFYLDMFYDLIQNPFTQVQDIMVQTDSSSFCDQFDILFAFFWIKMK
jgi:hypothetical protein